MLRVYSDVLLVLRILQPVVEQIEKHDSSLGDQLRRSLSSVALNTSADLLVTALAGPLGNRIRSSVSFRHRQRTATGMIMIGLGTYLATSEK